MKSRAGENGKGFAVVATEVRNLAEKLKESANEINHLIQLIQTNTKDTVNVMQKVNKRLQKEKKPLIKQIKHSHLLWWLLIKSLAKFKRYLQRTEEMSAGTEEVNASISSVSETATQIAKETTQTVQSIQSQAASIEEVSNQSNNIKEKVEALSELVSKFIIETQKWKIK